ncbi:YbaB/EbfC family nucleoid-associated protein [Campylobacter jejuni]|nr:YbaB/EbfC family nucleoid-associated protein [Campylobacter jejuni]
MFENMDFSKMGELLNQVQEKAKNIELELANREFSAKSGAGLVKVSANGKGEIIDVSVSIDDSLLEDKESLQILLISAINDVLAMVAQNRSSMANDVLGGFGGMKL